MIISGVFLDNVWDDSRDNDFTVFSNRFLEKEVAELTAKESESPKKKRGPSTTELFKEKEKIDKEVARRKEKIQSSNKAPDEKKSDMKLVERWREEMYERVEAQYRMEMDNNDTI